MSIILAQKKDLSDIQKLNQQIFDYEIKHCQPYGWNANYPYEKDGIEYLTKAIENRDNYIAFIYEENNQNIAYMILYDIPNKDSAYRNNIKLVQLHTLCVADGNRGRGVGKKMIEFAKQWAFEKGATHLRVGALTKNKRARAIYEKSGFEKLEVTYEMKINNSNKF